MWAWRRGDRTVVAMNCSDEPADVDDAGTGAIRISTIRARDGERVDGIAAPRTVGSRDRLARRLSDPDEPQHRVEATRTRDRPSERSGKDVASRSRPRPPPPSCPGVSPTINARSARTSSASSARREHLGVGLLAAVLEREHVRVDVAHRDRADGSDRGCRSGCRSRRPSECRVRASAAHHGLGIGKREVRVGILRRAPKCAWASSSSRPVAANQRQVTRSGVRRAKCHTARAALSISGSRGQGLVEPPDGVGDLVVSEHLDRCSAPRCEPRLDRPRR